MSLRARFITAGSLTSTCTASRCGCVWLVAVLILAGALILAVALNLAGALILAVLAGALILAGARILAGALIWSEVLICAELLICVLNTKASATEAIPVKTENDLFMVFFLECTGSSVRRSVVMHEYAGQERSTK